jgi:UDP-N-acetylmuramate dehydrogenase
MMVAQRYDPPVAGGLLERLPAVRGRYAENVEMAPFTWFRVGGPAEVVFRPADLADLAAFLMAKPDDVPVSVIGVTSNLLVRDGGIAGVVVRPGKFGSVLLCWMQTSLWRPGAPGGAVSNSSAAFLAVSVAGCG